MASYLQIENISKSYGPKILFQNIGFNINQGDKIALVAPNGTGKTSLLRILAGKDKSDSGGKITFIKDIRISFLEQDYCFEPEYTVLEQIQTTAPVMDPDQKQAFDLNVNKFLTGFGIAPESKMKELSGGEVKRVALTAMLATDADFYIMDEPTNHLDLDAIEFLEGYLSKSRLTLLMVTHDRYFLERVCNTIIEMDHGALYTYKGDYENYLQKRQDRIENYNAETDKVRNILRRELEWMHATPCARTGKAKYRKDAFYALQERSQQVYLQRQVDMDNVPSSKVHLGNKVFDAHSVGINLSGKCLLSDFSYNFCRGERVGIVGSNGIGKSTFLKLLSGELPADAVSGSFETGESVRIGYYKQTGIEFKPTQTVLETVSDTHLLNRFLFSHDMFNNRIEKLSGGEKRRLYLLTVLMQQPNVLILDEPTNDLDIVTLNVLEEYLLEFKGTLVIVSHDRHFLDRLADHLLIFCGNGVVKDFIGGYTEYRSFMKDYNAEQKSLERGSQTKQDTRTQSVAVKADRQKMTFKEKREFEQLESDIAALEAEKESLTNSMNSGTMPFDQLQAASDRYKKVLEELDRKEERWLELSEKS
ncbi:MAG: ABC-F family ATP-binding cassette domain-containing protein [Bacteroidaceae bacterium]|nr:ABC-F family ATP-binding cassette domain-containing protein [Bacteroidaceae bacterium]